MSTNQNPVLEETLDLLFEDAFDGLWAVIVENDDVTTFQTVIKALMEIFQHSEEAAETLAWTVHRNGEAVVAVGSREFATAGVQALHRRLIGARSEPA